MEYSLTVPSIQTSNLSDGLNPYSNGILSDSMKALQRHGSRLVLILILMEYSLTEAEENALATIKGLNPYSNGILSDSLWC